MNILLVSSTIALAMLVAHSWRTRGRRVTIAFFLAATAFGFLRGNAIWLLSKFLGGTDEALMPYLPQGGFLPDMGHVSIQVALGWVFAMYLAWTVSELILGRLPRFAGRVFMIAGLASLFMLTICYAMETTAVAVGWWYWTLSTRTALFGNVNVWAMEGWFSVIPDFLIPFLVIVCSESRSKRRWLWLLAFPLHILGHLAWKWFPHAILVYNAMELLVVLLAMFSVFRTSRGGISEPPAGRTSVPHLLGGVALVIFFGVVAVANVFGKVGIAGQLTIVPMMLSCILAWRRVPAWVVLVLSLVGLAGWHWIGARALYALVPPAALGLLRLLELLREPLWLRLVLPLATVVLTAWAVLVNDADRDRAVRYMRTWIEGDQLAIAGKHEQATEAYRRADALRPHDSALFYRVLEGMTQTDAVDVRQGSLLFEWRLDRVVKELEEVVRRDPERAEPRKTLARFHLLRGDLSSATEQYREMHRQRPQDPRIMAMFGYLLLRDGRIGEAEEIYTLATRSRQAPVEALINLGVIRFHQRRDDDARRLWEQALVCSPGHVIARLNLDRPKDALFAREIDLRFLAQTETSREVAAWTNMVASLGKRLTRPDRLRLFLEATQFDPDYLLAHMNLVNYYLREQESFHDKERALWHARRAADIARSSGDSKKLPESLLLLGRALLANGKPEEARRVLEEGRSLAPREMRAEFDKLR